MESALEIAGILFAALDYFGFAEVFENVSEWAREDLNSDWKIRTSAGVLITVMLSAWIVLHPGPHPRPIASWSAALQVLGGIAFTVFVATYLLVGALSVLIFVLRVGPRGVVGSLGLLLALAPMLYRHLVAE